MTEQCSQKSTLASNSEEAIEEWPSLEIAYLELRWRYERQLEEIAGLDQKSNFGLGSSTLIFAALTAVQEEHYPNLTERLSLEAAFMTTAIVSYFVVIVAWYLAFRIQRYAITPDAAYIAETLVHLPPEEAKALE
ncbi:hypothetical protein BH23CHL5_BH23CHL5_12250 [soil metagenome]